MYFSGFGMLYPEKSGNPGLARLLWLEKNSNRFHCTPFRFKMGGYKITKFLEKNQVFIMHDYFANKQPLIKIEVYLCMHLFTIILFTWLGSTLIKVGMSKTAIFYVTSI
jgi:hypothetical protein